MNKTVISRIKVLAEITAALAELVRVIECEPTADIKAAKEVCAEALCRVVRIDEAIGLVKMISYERIACRICSTPVPSSKAVGPVCIWCHPKTIHEGVQS